jgi:KaiC/GvpD/RAD55 family RecA-like ATPase
MTSSLHIIPVESLQRRANTLVAAAGKTPGVYVSLNKTHTSVQALLDKSHINRDNLFFIDCVTMERTKDDVDDVLHIHPSDLERLGQAIRAFIAEINGKKYVVIDSLATLLIYNDHLAVARFVKEVTEFAASNDVDVIALSPVTKGEDLLNTIFNFFDNVKK